MKRIHIIFIALVLGVAAAAGLFAATRTVGLGQAASAHRTSEHAVAARSARLDRLERSLDKALGKRRELLNAEVSRARRRLGGGVQNEGLSSRRAGS